MEPLFEHAVSLTWIFDAAINRLLADEPGTTPSRYELLIGSRLSGTFVNLGIVLSYVGTVFFADPYVRRKHFNIAIRCVCSWERLSRGEYMLRLGSESARVRGQKDGIYCEPITIREMLQPKLPNT